MLLSILVSARPTCPDCGTYSKDGNPATLDTCSFCQDMNVLNINTRRLKAGQRGFRKVRPVIILPRGLFCCSCQVTRLIGVLSAPNARLLFRAVFNDPCKEVRARYV